MAASDTRDEVALARDLLAGAPGAFDSFVEVFRSKIFHYAQMVCGQPEDAEEVAQDTLLKVFSNIGQLREPERVKAWVFRIARNECLMRKRKSVFAPTQELSLDAFLPHKDSDDGRRLEIADWSALPDDQALRAELKEVVHTAIGQLPEIYRSVILLRDIEELTTEEAAEVLDISREAVKTRLHRARLAVRQMLDEYMKGARAGGRR